MADRYDGIVVLGDWFRFISPRHSLSLLQKAQVAWLAALLEPIFRDLNVPIATAMPSERPLVFARQFNNDGLLAYYEEDADAAWAGCYDGQEARACFASLYDEIPAGRLVVGFEIPPVMRRTLDGRGFSYISFHNHPIRFLKDLAFGAYSNDSTLQALLLDIACDEQEVTRQVMRFSARFARHDFQQTCVPPGLPLLLGQTSSDSSLIVDGRMAQWRDFEDRLEQILKGYREVLFLKHPHAPWKPELIEFLRQDLGKTVIGLAGNSYPLIMSHRDLGSLATLSSSLGVEAMRFGHQCEFLIGDPQRKFAVAGLDNISQPMIDHRLLTVAFWKAVLGRGGLGTTAEGSGFFLGDDFIRSTLESWSFKSLHIDGQLEPMAKSVFPCAALTEAQQGRLLHELYNSVEEGKENIVRQAAADDITIQVAQPPLTIGTHWCWTPSAGNAELALVSGFHRIEDQGVWSATPRSAMDIPVFLRGRDKMMIDCEAELSFFRGILPETPAIVVRSEGLPRAAVIHEKDDEPFCRLTWTMPAPAGPLCSIRFECSHMNSTQDLNIGSDARQLGFMLHRLALSARPRDPSDAGEAARLWGVAETPIELLFESE